MHRASSWRSRPDRRRGSTGKASCDTGKCNYWLNPRGWYGFRDGGCSVTNWLDPPSRSYILSPPRENRGMCHGQFQPSRSCGRSISSAAGPVSVSTKSGSTQAARSIPRRRVASRWLSIGSIMRPLESATRDRREMCHGVGARRLPRAACDIVGLVCPHGMLWRVDP